IALPDIAQPRGVAGTLFVHKIAGHLSETGRDLVSVAAAARAAAKDIFSLGISLSSCSLPGQAHEDRFGAEDGELGLGIHGEPGVERIAEEVVGHFPDARTIVLSSDLLGGVRRLRLEL
ncbi:dihydroxyacetone kinase, partial [Mesorhizobium sp. M1C.F.Ca.ET.204.01.1.1]|uniref:dihydroxyacetone kinase subunit DhaK n=1 Tax=Mesorhizobium sp. M1C.F.Ca.ET.204.01.1.1 TaxID=2563929 RepID=UPI00113753A9